MLKNMTLFVSSLQHGETAIHLSCGLGQLDALKFLVKKGGGLETTDTQGDTPLHWAARQGHAHIIAYLIEQGAQINTQNKVRIGLLCLFKSSDAPRGFGHGRCLQFSVFMILPQHLSSISLLPLLSLTTSCLSHSSSLVLLVFFTYGLSVACSFQSDIHTLKISCLLMHFFLTTFTSLSLSSSYIPNSC